MERDYIGNLEVLAAINRNTVSGQNLKVLGMKYDLTDSELQEMVQYCKDHGIHIYDEEKERVLLRAYAFIQVSRHEGQPMGIMEALSYGLPCIVTYGTSFGEYINKNNCGIGINFDENELFGAIKKMIEDRDFRDTCAKNAKMIEREYDWEKVIGLCLNKYKELI